ncbi:hypothetical protein VNO80_27832 [Phaseolus coccineus]|uniref:Secreted protein n=1 Tax=Phaseolus coccineus TaxID=3886 RepID=A0AAN9LKJ4_PHACN
MFICFRLIFFVSIVFGSIYRNKLCPYAQHHSFYSWRRVLVGDDYWSYGNVGLRRMMMMMTPCIPTPFMIQSLGYDMCMDLLSPLPNP